MHYRLILFGAASLAVSFFLSLFAMKLAGRSLVLAMCVGQLGNLLPHVAVPAVMPQHLMPAWGLDGTEAGLMASAFAFGYMFAVPVLTTLTDRIDARKILMAGSVLSALGTLMFGFFASGLWSGACFNAIAGVGFAGAYMPGLKALTDRLAPGDSSRAVTLYTSSFSFGVGLSFLVSQLVAEGWGWPTAFLVTAAGPIVMLLVCFLLRPVKPKPAQGRLLDFAPVFRNTAAMGYVLGYGAHCFELYGIRTWLVAFWTFVAMKVSPWVDASAAGARTETASARVTRTRARRRTRAKDERIETPLLGDASQYQMVRSCCGKCVAGA